MLFNPPTLFHSSKWQNTSKINKTKRVRYFCWSGRYPTSLLVQKKERNEKGKVASALGIHPTNHPPPMHQAMHRPSLPINPNPIFICTQPMQTGTKLYCCWPFTKQTVSTLVLTKTCYVFLQNFHVMFFLKTFMSCFTSDRKMFWFKINLLWKLVWSTTKSCLQQYRFT